MSSAVWPLWKDGNPNHGPAARDKRCQFIRITPPEDKGLRPGLADPRESMKYELKIIPGRSSRHRADLEKLVDGYNLIAKLRRRVLNAMDNKQRKKDKDIVGDLMLITKLSESYKKLFIDFEAKGLEPPKFPQVFSKMPALLRKNGKSRD